MSLHTNTDAIQATIIVPHKIAAMNTLKYLTTGKMDEMNRITASS